MAIKLKTIDHTAIFSIVVAICCFVAFWISDHLAEGLSIFAGTLWGAANLVLLKKLIPALLLKTPGWSRVLLLSLKCPLLYLAGYGLLKTGYLSPPYLVIGFSLIFGVLVIVGVRNAKWSA